MIIISSHVIDPFKKPQRNDIISFIKDGCTKFNPQRDLFTKRTALLSLNPTQTLLPLTCLFSFLHKPILIPQRTHTPRTHRIMPALPIR